MRTLFPYLALTLLCVPACVPIEPDRPPVQTFHAYAGRNWSYAVRFHDANFSFEVLPDEKWGLALPSPGQDLLGIHSDQPRAAGYRNHLFHIQGKTHPVNRGASFYLFRVPEAGSEWKFEGPPVTITWVGDGQAFPVEENYNELVEWPHPNPRKKVLMAQVGPPHRVWTILGTRIHLRPDKTVEITRGRMTQTVHSPCTIRLGSRGEILEAR